MMDWNELIENIINKYCSDNSTIGEQLEAVYSYVEQTYGTSITGEGYVYFGTLSDGVQVYKVVDGVCKLEGNGYITSTEAGKLFNEKNFIML